MTIYKDMPIAERFAKHYILFEDPDHGYRLELWNASTKHPDSIFYFDNFEKVDWIDDVNQIFQWVLECASKLIFPFNAMSLTKWAIENVYTLEE